MKTTHRMEKINNLLKKTLSSIFLEEMERPLDNFITIIAVDTKPDLSSATIIISALKDEEEIIQNLNEQNRHIRYLLGKKVRLKKIPQLLFKPDPFKDLF
jgi:ribosome-binding factor A